MKAEAPAEAGDMLRSDLVNERIHQLVGIDPATEERPVPAEVPAAKCRRHNYGAMRLGEGCPPPNGRLRVMGQVLI